VFFASPKRQKQIPFGNDKQEKQWQSNDNSKGIGIGKGGLPSGMRSEKGKGVSSRLAV